MQVAKLRILDTHGLVPAGRYFEQLAKSLRAANAANAATAEKKPAPEQLQAQRRQLQLETRRRKRSQSTVSRLQ
jgi:hypothetical protein